MNQQLENSIRKACDSVGLSYDVQEKLLSETKHYEANTRANSIYPGKIIHTSDGVLAMFGSIYIDPYGQLCIKSPIANNIGEHICINGTFRLNDWRYATEEEVEYFSKVVSTYIKSFNYNNEINNNYL